MKTTTETDHPQVIALPPLLFLGFLVGGVVLEGVSCVWWVCASVDVLAVVFG